MLDTRFFTPDFRGNYPHMFPYDIAVWERFLDKYSETYEGFYYDVTVGVKSRRFPHWKPEYKKDAVVLSQLRIDAIGIRAGAIDIIEIKPRGNMAALGQLLTYKEHYINEYAPTSPVFMLLVCGELDPNIKPILEQNGIISIVV